MVVHWGMSRSVHVWTLSVVGHWWVVGPAHVCMANVVIHWRVSWPVLLRASGGIHWGTIWAVKTVRGVNLFSTVALLWDLLRGHAILVTRRHFLILDTSWR